MDFIGTALIIIFVISALLLIVIVLLQDEQGEGLGGIFGGGSSANYGSRSGNIMTKFTTVLAVIFLSTSFGLAWINRTPEAGDVVGAARRAENQDGTVQEEWWIAPEESTNQTQ